MGILKNTLKKLFNNVTKVYSDIVINRKIVLPAFKLKRNLPVNLIASDLPYFTDSVNGEFEAITEAVLENAYLAVTEGLIIKGFRIVDESLMEPNIRHWYGTHLFKPYLKHEKLENDNYLMVFNHFGSGYGHWLVDILPRLYVKKNELKNFKILFPTDYNRFQLDSLLPFGIDEANIRYVKYSKYYKIPKVTVLSHIGTSCNTKDEILQELRGLYLTNYFGKTKPEPIKKIYISRMGMVNRNVINETEVEQLIERYDFEVIRPQNYSFEQQVKMFAECKVLIGLTGSGLTNMLFMQSGASVIEFKMENDYQDFHYFSMSSAMNLDYYYLMCSAVGDNRLTADFKVDTLKLEEILKSLHN